MKAIPPTSDSAERVPLWDEARLGDPHHQNDKAARVEAIRLERAAVKDELFDTEGAAHRFAKALGDYGLDVGQLDPAEAARRIAASAIREQLVAALDDWLIVAPGGECGASELRAWLDCQHSVRSDRFCP